MQSPFLKSFFVYAYSFVLLLLFNSFLASVLLKAGASPLMVKLVTYAISPVFLFFSYQYSLKKFGSFNDEKLLAKAWIYHFVPFVAISFVLSWLVVVLFKGAPWGIFLLMNLELVVVFFTFKFSYEKVLER